MHVSLNGKYGGVEQGYQRKEEVTCGRNNQEYFFLLKYSFDFKWKIAEQPSNSSRKLPKFEPKNSAWQIKSMFFIKTIPVGVISKSRIGKNFYEYGNMVTFLPYL